MKRIRNNLKDLDDEYINKITENMNAELLFILTNCGLAHNSVMGSHIGMKER